MAFVGIRFRTRAGRVIFYLIWIPLLILLVMAMAWSESEISWFVWLVLQLIAIGIAALVSKVVEKRKITLYESEIKRILREKYQYLDEVAIEKIGICLSRGLKPEEGAEFIARFTAPEELNRGDDS